MALELNGIASTGIRQSINQAKPKVDVNLFYFFIFIYSSDTYSLDDTPVVHATLDSLTNDFKVTQLSSRQWDQQDVWESHEQSSGRFSNIKEPTATFRLNLDIPDAPVFSKVVDYSSFRDQEIVPDRKSVV